jgi:hypothetical protein
MPHTIGTPSIIVADLLSVIGTPPAEYRRYIGISYESAGDNVYAIEYHDGIEDHVVATKSIPALSALSFPLNFSIVDYSPLAVAWLGTDGIVVWNITTNTVYTHSLPTAISGLAGPYSLQNGTLAYGGDGYAHYIMYDVSFGTGGGAFGHFKFDAVGGHTEVAGGELHTVMDYVLPNIFWDGVQPYMLGANDSNVGGIIKITGAPSFTPNDTFLPPGNSDDFAAYGTGHYFDGEAISYHSAASSTTLNDFFVGIWDGAPDIFDATASLGVSPNLHIENYFPDNLTLAGGVEPTGVALYRHTAQKIGFALFDGGTWSFNSPVIWHDINAPSVGDGIGNMFAAP